MGETKASKKIFISCGELSGESHAARVCSELFKLQPEVEIRAMGSYILAALGAELSVDYREYSFSGATEVVMNLPKILALKDRLADEIFEWKPDIVLLVDYGGFNLELAKALHHRFKDKPENRPYIVEYIAPQIWASRSYRINKIKAYVDKVLCTLPFEKKIYDEAAIPVSYVGNPVAESLHPECTKQELMQALNNKRAQELNTENIQRIINPEDELLIGIFPGSRKSEIKYLLPQLIEAAQLTNEAFKQAGKKLRFVLAQAPTIPRDLLEQYGLNKELEENLISIINAEVLVNANHKLMKAADALWLCSGTATLEAALIGTPYFLTYAGNLINYSLYKIFKIIDMAGLANIIADKYIVKEFLQKNANAKNFTQETLSWFDLSQEEIKTTNYFNRISGDFNKLRDQLMEHKSSIAVANELSKLLS